MADYIGILDKGKDAWGVRIPDLSGCYGAGLSPEEAIADAASAAREWIDHQQARGIDFPARRSMTAIMFDSDIAPAEGEALVIVPVVLDTGRTVRANLTLDAGLLDAIDAEASRRKITRSAFVASAAREKIEANR